VKDRSPTDASAVLRWSPVAIAIAIAVLAAWVWVLVPPLVNSDSAAVVLLAQELAKSGGWLSPDWYYVSDSLMFDGSVHAARIGVLLFGASVDAARFTIAAGIVVALLAGAWLGRTLSVRPAHALLAMCAFLLGPSLIYQDLILGLPTTFQVALVLALLACAIRFGLQKGGTWHLALAAALVVLMSASAPKKALVYMLVPMVAGVASQWLGGRDRDASAGWRRPWMLLLATVAAWGIGDWLHALLKRGLVVNTSYARMSFVPDPGHVLDNARTIAALAWKFAGGGGGLLAAGMAALAIACWAWLLVAPVARRRPWRALRGPRGFAWSFALGGTLAIAAYLLLYQQIRLYYGIYYALVTMSPLFLLPVARAPDEADAKARAWISRGALSCLLLLGIATTAMACVEFPADYFGTSKNQRSTSTERAQAIDWLAANGYRRGFADYWDANAMTLVSNGRLQVGSFHFLPRRSRTTRHAWLSNVDRTNFVPGREAWFIAINARRRALKPIADCLPADRVVTVASYRLYLYHAPVPDCLPPPVRPRRG
jgi:hypothetical protein